MKNFVKLLGFVIILFGFPMVASANSISKIDMDIYVDSEGDAHVTETWVSTVTSGTEVYKSYYNLGNASISNFRVSEDGEYYDSLSSWDTSLSFDEKAYKNGIHYVSEGVELCWGISEYGYHEYELSYDIEGFVASLSDSDMIYWTLIPADLSPKPNDVYIKIYSDFDYSSTLDVWGYGNYGGTAYVYDGYIEMGSDGALSSDEYMTVLVKFDKGMFNTSNVIDKDFDYYYDMAQEGAVSYNDNSDMKVIIVVLFFFVGLFIIGNLMPKIVKAGREKLVGTLKLYIKKEDRNLSDVISNVREIPFDNNICYAFWVAEAYGLNSKKTDFLGAILLKWLMEGRISVREEGKGDVIVLKSSFDGDDIFEVELYNMIRSASKDGVLESREFELWCQKNCIRVISWFDKVLDRETNRLINDGKIVDFELTDFKVFKSSTLAVSSVIKDDAVTMKGLKNFLEEFSRIDDKEAIEVNMWEYYLIYAQILGIADRVSKQFEKLYPEVINNPNYNFSYSNVAFVSSVSHVAMKSANSYAKAKGYGAGGGGRSSGGGGHGSSGSGGGGGFR